MKKNLYLRLAREGIRKNKKLYLPYLMTGALMTAVYYILFFLSRSEMVRAMHGGSSTSVILLLGSIVITVFAAIFLLYTNSFLIRRRKKEFGLYHVLGMTKGNIGRILSWETFLCYLISMAAGLLCGITASKLAELSLLRLIHGEVDFSFRISPQVIGYTLGYFAGIFFLLYLRTRLQIRKAAAISLIRSENAGEKPPKANWALGILGAFLLGCAYFLAVKIQQPLDALVFFFVAVILVIIGTYLLFIAGSVMLCRILQKNKSFYYKAQNFVSVSSMTYRMKRNGAGLASICILLTMVLVMLSSSACLYFGKDVALSAQYPRDICAFASWYGYGPGNQDMIAQLNELTDAAVQKAGITPRNIRCYDEYCISGLLEKSHVSVTLNSASDLSFINYDRIAEVHFIRLADYNRLYHLNEILQPGEAIVCAVKTTDVADAGGVFSVEDLEFRVVQRIDQGALDFNGASLASVCANVFVIVDDIDPCARHLRDHRDYDGTAMLVDRWYYQFDCDGTPEQQAALADTLEKSISSRLKWDSTPGSDTVNLYVSCHDAERGDFFGTFGGLFFIGITLSLVFLLSAALIIYYKQISEGYEDQSRFATMQKVGMTKGDIRRSINAQMRTVFFLPIGFAVLHLAFAFPFIYKLLMLFSVFHLPLLLLTTACSVLLCLLFYVAVYRLTSNTYYGIVTGAGE